MPIVNGKYVNPGWVNNTSPYINAAEMNDISNTLANVPVANGGTGKTSLTSNAILLGNGTSAIKTLNSVAGALFSQGNGNLPAYGTLPIAYGGTGKTTAAGVRNALGLGNTTGALPIANGGTGSTNVAGARNALGLGNTTGALPVENGGTGTSSVEEALPNLGLINQHSSAEYSSINAETQWLEFGAGQNKIILFWIYCQRSSAGNINYLLNYFPSPSWEWTGAAYMEGNDSSISIIPAKFTTEKRLRVQGAKAGNLIVTGAYYHWTET